MWNTLDEGLKNQPTISSFKNNLQITTFPKLQVPKYFLTTSHQETDIYQ